MQVRLVFLFGHPHHGSLDTLRNEGYTWDEEMRAFIPHEVNVLTLRGAEIEEITAFLTPDALARFGLPDLIPA